MNIYNDLESLIKKKIKSKSKDLGIAIEVKSYRFNIERSKNPDRGDISTNAAMVFAKPLNIKPRLLGEWLTKELKCSAHIQSAEIAGPGFLNIRMKNDFWHSALKEILIEGPEYGKSELGIGKKVNIEYVSANPTGPMHVGHGRGAIVGDVLANLLEKAGFDVTREFYINDAGKQIDILAHSVFFRYQQALGKEISNIPEGLYPGEYLMDTGKKLAEMYGGKWLEVDKSKWLPTIKEFAVKEMLGLIRKDLELLGVKHKIFTSEKSLIDAFAIDEVIEYLEQQNLVYTGLLDEPKGKKSKDWEKRPQLLFRSSKFGDECDRPLKKSNGTNTYFASDIAYHRDKYLRGFNKMIDVWGADHKGYVRRMEAAVSAITGDNGTLEVRLCNLVNLFEDGEPIKMSKRAGRFVTLADVIDAVGKDVVRFIMLTRSNEATLDFDLSKVKEQSKDNPVFYVQYAHARTCSVIRNAAETFPYLSLDDSRLANADQKLIVDMDGYELVKLLCNWPKVVESAALAQEPHRIVFFLSEIASAFHTFWNRGNEDESYKFIIPSSAEKTVARVALARAVAIVIASGLAIVGVEAVEEMR